MGNLAGELLAWYDSHARVMPWRVSPRDRTAGVRPDPYAVWMSEVMLQQTTVAAVRAYFRRFLERWPTVDALAAAQDADVMGEWAGLGYYARARNLLACARAVALRGGFPDTRDGLLELPGIGPYTASAIAAIAYDEPAVVVDGNVERVMARMFAVMEPLPGSKGELTRLAATLTPANRPGDYAQAVMDLGATICTPRNPACGICPWMGACQARAKGIAAELPRKVKKAVVPKRHGTVWLARRKDGAWLVETRGAKGLLGGMLGWPGSDWDGGGGDAPLAVQWERLGEVRHTFTHFHLYLDVMLAHVAVDTTPLRGAFHPGLRPSDLPTVMRKAYDLASSALSPR